MMRLRAIPLAVLLLSSVGTGAAQVADLSGSWKLNVEKSKWGKRPKLVSAIVQIEHREPVIKFTGIVVDAQQESRHFAFEGRIDGKEYPGVTAYGDGIVVMRRVDSRTIASEYRSRDGRARQSIRTSVSRDGKTLTRRLRAAGPDGTVSWTEIWEKL